MNPQESTRQLLVQLKSPKATERKRASQFLGSLKTSDKVSVSVLRDALEVLDEEDVIFWSVVALSRLRSRSKAAIGSLLKLLQHKQPVIRQAVVNALAAIAPKEHLVKEALIESLKDKSPFVRRQVLQELIRFKNLTWKDLNKIQAIKNDPEPQVADWAEIALRNIRLPKKG